MADNQEHPNGTCDICKGPCQVYGCRWCEACYYPGLEEDWQRFLNLRAEGYPRHQAMLMSGLADPPDPDD